MALHEPKHAFAPRQHLPSVPTTYPQHSGHTAAQDNTATIYSGRLLLEDLLGDT